MYRFDQLVVGPAGLATVVATNRDGVVVSYLANWRPGMTLVSVPVETVDATALRPASREDIVAASRRWFAHQRPVRPTLIIFG
jgi:hypothetical protein